MEQLHAKETELKTVSRQLEEQSELSSHLSEVLCQVRAEQAELVKSRQVLEVAHRQKVEMVEELRQQCNRLQGELNTAHHLTQSTQQRDRELIDVIQRERVELAQQNVAILSSMSWHVTAPLRALTGVLKNIRMFDLSFKLAHMLVNNGVKVTMGEIRRHFCPSSINTENVATESEASQIQHLPESISILDFVDACQQDGGKMYLATSELNESVKKVLLVSHELNLTGAPIALGYFAEALLSKGYYPIIIAPKDDSLREVFVQKNISVIVYEKLYLSNLVARFAQVFDFLVINTIVGAPIVEQLSGHETPVLWWIHEARVSYHPGALAVMPESVGNNIHIYCVGNYAMNMLHEYRPLYKAEQLLYCVPDLAVKKRCVSTFRLNDVQNRTVFAIIGVLEERKAQDILVEAIRLLNDSQKRRSLFVFVGMKWYAPIYDAIQALMEEYPEMVRYYPQLNQQDIAALYEQIDCLLCTSRDDPMPVVITEAMTLSKAIICSENTGSAAIIEKMHSGLIYYQNSPVQLAEHIVSVLEHPDEMITMQKNARHAYEEYFSEQVFSRNVARVLADMVDEEKLLGTCEGKVSVIIPTYQAGEQFGMLLRLLRQQRKIQNLEIVIVDSGSCDATIQIAKAFDAKVIQITQVEFSHSHARNLGAEHASGQYLLFMTQDAMPDGELWVAKLMQPVLWQNVVAVSCKERPRSDCDLLGRFSIWVHSEYMGILHCDRIMSMPKEHDFDHLRRNAQLNDVACLVRRDVFEQFRYRGNYAEDLDMGLRLIEAGYKTALMSSVQVIHSHTRQAIYHLKRCLVDNRTLKKILPDFPCMDIAEQTIANRVVTEYLILGEVIRQSSACTCLDMAAFAQWLQQAFAVAYARVQQNGLAKVETVLQQRLAYDSSLRIFMSEIYSAYKLCFEWDDAISGDQLHLAVNVLPRYLAENHEPFCMESKAEILEMLIKNLGQIAGIYLASYDSYHVGEVGTMHDLVIKYSTGV